VAVVLVVVVEELGAERPGVFDAAEAVGERRAIFQGFVRYAGDPPPGPGVLPTMVLF
jgi:hypothetical protein